MAGCADNVVDRLGDDGDASDMDSLFGGDSDVDTAEPAPDAVSLPLPATPESCLLAPALNAAHSLTLPASKASPLPASKASPLPASKASPLPEALTLPASPSAAPLWPLPLPLAFPTPAATPTHSGFDVSTSPQALEEVSHDADQPADQSSGQFPDIYQGLMLPSELEEALGQELWLETYGQEGGQDTTTTATAAASLACGQPQTQQQQQQKQQQTQTVDTPHDTAGLEAAFPTTTTRQEGYSHGDRVGYTARGGDVSPVSPVTTTYTPVPTGWKHHLELRPRCPEGPPPAQIHLPGRDHLELLPYVQLDSKLSLTALFQRLGFDAETKRIISIECRLHVALLGAALRPTGSQDPTVLRLQKSNLILGSLDLLRNKGKGEAWFGRSSQVRPKSKYTWPEDSTVIVLHFIQLLYIIVRSDKRRDRQRRKRMVQNGEAVTARSSPESTAPAQPEYIVID